MITINEFIINKANINYIWLSNTNSDGYIWRKTYHLHIYFDKDNELHLKTYDEGEYKKWIKLIKE